MSIVFIESFDGFHQTDGQPINTCSAFATKWTLDIGTAELTQPGRGLGKACGLVNFGRITRNIPTIVTPLIGFALKVVSVPAQCGLLLPRFNSNTNRAQLVLNTDRTLSVRRGDSTVLATTFEALDLDVWYYVEFKTKMTETAGSYELRIDGVTSVSDPNVSMDNTGTPGTNNISFGAASGSEVHIDDVYILDCDEPDRNDFLGPCKVEHRRPVANSSVAWTPSAGANWAAIDEAPPDGDSSYVETSTPGAVDLFSIDPVP
jgi:hypothetical protein